jgi:hypothetical protein
VNDQPALAFGDDEHATTFGQLAGPLHLPSLSGAAREQVKTELREWVADLVRRFCVDARAIPPCWEKHGGMVEALLALRDHERACFAQSAAPTAAVDWLRALQDVTHFLKELNAMTQCTIHEHRDPPQRPVP